MPKNKNNLKKYNHVYMVLDQALNSGATFVLNVVLVRLYGIEWFGSFTQVIIICLLVAGIFYASISSHMLTFYQKKHEDDKDAYMSAMLVFQITGAVLLSLVVLAAIPLVKFGLLGAIDPRIAVVYVLSFVLFDFFRKSLMAQEKASSLLIINIVFFILQATFIFVISRLPFPLPLNEFFTYWAGITVFSGMIAFFSTGIKIRSLGGEKIHSELRGLFSFSKWMVPSSLLMWFGEAFLLLMLGAYKGSESLGRMRILQSVVAVFSPVLILLENTISIGYSRRYIRSGAANLYRKCIRDMLVSSALCLAVAGLAYFFGDVVLKVLYGKNHLDQSAQLTVYVLIYTMVFSSLFLRAVARTMGGARYIFIAASIAASVSLITHRYLIDGLAEWGFLLSLGAYNLAFSMTLLFAMAMVKHRLNAKINYEHSVLK